MNDGRRTAAMVAYAIYATDARIKNYVHALTARGWEVDVYANIRYLDDQMHGFADVDPRRVIISCD